MQNYNLKFKTFYLILLLLSFAFCPLTLPIAHAQAVRSFTISPPTVEKQNLLPGQWLEGTMKVLNNNDMPLTFQVDVQDFYVSDTNGTPLLLPPHTLAKKYSAASWIGIYPDSFTIAAHSAEIIHYFIQVPKDVRPGGHYASAVFKPIHDSQTQATGASVNTQIGSLFYLPVAGNIYEHADVSKFLTDHGFYEYGPVQMMLEIANRGDQHIKPLGTIIITNMLGATVARLPLEQHNIFPGASRDFETNFSKHWLLGRYKVQLIASYGKNNAFPLVASIYFFVFPWKVAVVITLVIILIILSLLYWRKTKQSKIQPPSSTSDAAFSPAS